ncbi:MAG: ABC transporter permease [Acidobacteria bacterium]|nr:ABC transporter permease [Acidobacteriota bacterium]
MNKIWVIIKREYLNIVKKKSFLVSAILTPILMVGLILLPSFLAGVALIKEREIAVIDETGYVLPALEAKRTMFEYIVKEMKNMEENQDPTAQEQIQKQIEKEAKEKGLPGGQALKLMEEMSKKVYQSFAAIHFEEIKVENGQDLKKIKENQLDRIRTKKIDVLLIIPKGVETNNDAVSYFSTSSSNFDETSLLREFISETIVDKRIADEGMNAVKIKQMTQPVLLNTNDVTKTGTKKGSFLVTYFVGITFVMLLFMAVIQTGQHLFRGVIEEKSNRIIEVLLSSIKPKQLMGGKIIGLGGAGLTLVAIWSIAGLLGLKLSGGFGVTIAPITILYFIIFFVLGYLLYSTFMAIIGAIMNSEQEAQQFISIISMALMVPLFVAMIIVKHPDSIIATILTMIPPFTPSMMVFRLSITAVPMVEIIASIVVLIISIWIMIIATTKIFRVGILMYGKKPSVKEIVKWMKYK